MKIKHTFTLLAILTVLLASCKKSANNTPPVKKLKYLIQTTAVRGSTTSVVYCTYDDKKRLSTVKSGASTTTYTYVGNNLVSVESVTPPTGYRKTTDLTYSNDGTLSSTHDVIFRNGVVSTDMVFNYLVVNGRITERHFNNIYVDKYTYDDKGNTITFYSAAANTTTSYTYDDKLNINTNGFPNPNGLYFSPNNFTSDGSYTYTYTYDTDGYPTGATITDPTGATTKTTYTYTEM